MPARALFLRSDPPFFAAGPAGPRTGDQARCQTDRLCAGAMGSASAFTRSGPARRRCGRRDEGDAMSDAARPVTREQGEAAVRVLIQWAGDDPDREGLVETPARVVRSYEELFSGYAADPREYLRRTFDEVGGYDELVVLTNIPVVSFCEHHMLPFLGRAHVGYLPNHRVVGISKLARVVQGFARRLQIQEKLTAEIGEAILEVLQPR